MDVFNWCSCNWGWSKWGITTQVWRVWWVWRVWYIWVVWTKTSNRTQRRNCCKWSVCRQTRWINVFRSCKCCCNQSKEANLWKMKKYYNSSCGWKFYFILFIPSFQKSIVSVIVYFKFLWNILKVCEKVILTNFEFILNRSCLSILLWK